MEHGSRPWRGTAPRGFTMMELLAVIAIILVFVGLLIGVGAYASNASLVARCKAEIRAMETALEAYKADNGGYPPLNADALFATTNLLGYVSTEGFICTNFPNGQRIVGVAYTQIKYIPVLAPADPTGQTQYTNGWSNSQFIYRALTQGSKKYLNFSSNQVSAVSACGATPPWHETYTTNSLVPLSITTNRFSTCLIVDPWGFPYGYNPSTPKANPQTFDLWSVGPDNNSSNTFYFEYIPGQVWNWPNNDDIGNWQK